MTRNGSWDRRLFDLDYLAFAEHQISVNFGDKVSIHDKAKPLNKFGLRPSVGTSLVTIAEFPASNEVFVSTNIIDSVVSSSTSDTQTVVIEGHTIDNLGRLTFVTQDATVNGRTEVSLSTPLARANRMFIKPSGVFNSPQSLPSGVITVYDNTDGITDGVPNTDEAIKLELNIGEPQSQKCATSISDQDYYIITQIEAGVGTGGGNASRILVRPEVRDIVNGGVWRPLGRELTINLAANGVQINPKPHLIVPPNHDVRLRARVNSNTSSVFGEINGFLARIL